MSITNLSSGTLLSQVPSPASIFNNNQQKQISYPAPLRDLLSTYVPEDIKGIMNLCRYFFAFDPLVHAAMRNMAMYPLTKLTIQSVRYPKEAQVLQDMLYRELELQRFLHAMSLDYFVYGNAFCMHLSVNGSRLPVFRRVPVMEMSLGEDPTTGDTRYFWLISPAIRRMLDHKTDPEFKDDYNVFTKTFPGAQYVEQAVKNNKALIMRKKHFYHLRMEGESASNQHWGFPMIQPVLKTLFYRNILRKAQEALAMEHIVPLRIFFIQPPDRDSYSPAAYSETAQELAKIISKAANDPNMKVVSPAPVGVISAGGQGRMLMVTPEIQQLDETALAGMLVPREFVYGGLSYSGSSVSMRMTENRVVSFRNQLVDLVQNFVLPHVMDAVYPEFNASDFTVAFAELKALDDIQQKQLLINLNASGKLPDSMLYSALEIDPEDAKSGTLDDVKHMAELKMEQLRGDMLAKKELLPLEVEIMLQQAQAQMQAQGQLQPQGVAAPEAPPEGDMAADQGQDEAYPGAEDGADMRPMPAERPPRRDSVNG